jgi:hypothetical protein
VSNVYAKVGPLLFAVALGLAGCAGGLGTFPADETASPSLSPLLVCEDEPTTIPVYDHSEATDRVICEIWNGDIVEIAFFSSPSGLSSDLRWERQMTLILNNTDLRRDDISEYICGPNWFVDGLGKSGARDAILLGLTAEGIDGRLCSW